MIVNQTDYGIYIDRKTALIITLGYDGKEVSVIEISQQNNKEIIPRTNKVNEQEHIQNKERTESKRFCRSIISKIINANNIIIFGPATSKYDLQMELRNTKRLKNIKERVLTTDVMNRNNAIEFIKHQYSIASPQ